MSRAAVRPSLSVAVPCLVLAAAPGLASAQTFLGEEAERRIQYDWISNSLQDFGDDAVESFETEGGFDEIVSDLSDIGDYRFEVEASQTSEIEADAFAARGASSFLFAAGEFAQGAAVDVTASSPFFYSFETTAAGTFRLEGVLTTDDVWNVDISLVNDDTGAPLVEQQGSAELDELVELEANTLYVFEVASFGSFFVDDRNAFEITYEGASSYDITLTPVARLALEGDCPGAATLRSTGNEPAGTVGFVYAFAPGEFTIPGGICAGVTLGLAAPVTLGGTATADGVGVAELPVNLPNGACGNVFVQSVDATTCRTSNVLAL